MIPTIKTEDVSTETKTSSDVHVDPETSTVIEEEIEETVTVKKVRRTRISRSPSPSPAASPRFPRSPEQNGHHHLHDFDKRGSDFIINEIQDVADSSNIRVDPKSEAEEKAVLIEQSNGQPTTVQYSQPKSNNLEPLRLDLANEKSSVKEDDEVSMKDRCFDCFVFLDDCFTCRGTSG